MNKEGSSKSNMTGVLIRGKSPTEGRWHVKTEAETRVIQAQDKNTRTQATTRS